MAGGSIEKLREAMGHSTVLVTERYAHLRGDVFNAVDLGRMAVDLSPRLPGRSCPWSGKAEPSVSHPLATEAESTEENGVAAAGAIL